MNEHGHGPFRDTTIEVFGGKELEARQCTRCNLKVLDGQEPNGFETHSCTLIVRLSAPTILVADEQEGKP